MNYLNGTRWPAELMEWPPQSPDLNPIENLWSILDNKIRKRKKQPSNTDELFLIPQDEWQNLDATLLQNLVNSMPKRCQALINSRGYWIDY